MKILVLNPPVTSTSNIIRDAIYGCWCKGKRIGGAQTPPYPLLLIATILKYIEGVKIDFIDAPAQKLDIDALVSRLSGIDVVIILSSVMTFLEDVVIVGRLKEKFPLLKSIVAGAMPTFMPEFCLRHRDVDIVVRAEPEWIIRDLVRSFLKQDSSWQDIKGISYRGSAGIIHNPAYPLIQNLDDLPFVDWTFLPNGISYFNPLIKRYPYITDLTTRGCPERCTFCMSPRFYGKKVRARSAQNVIEGFKKHRREGYKEVYLRDEMFTTFRLRNKEICERMIKENIDLTWLCSARVDSLDYEMMRLMKNSGCHTIKFGVESGVQEILDNVNKGINLEDTQNVFRWAQELGINTHAHVMLGLPGENETSIKETMRFLYKINPTTASFGIVMPFPGTDLFDSLTDDYPEIKNGFSLDIKTLHSSSFFTHTFCDLSSEELSYYIKKMHRDFYWRLSYLLGWLKRIRSIGDFRKVVKAGINVLDFSLRADE
jgi:radical SAM superfamily enzyme YgiQ (UPF0313 family)